jgi:hypothetical protein
MRYCTPEPQQYNVLGVELASGVAPLDSTATRNFFTSFYERTISQDEYGPARQSLQERLVANRAALEAMERQREALPLGLRPGCREDLDAWWEDASLEEQRRALAHILDCVRVNRAAHRGGNRFQSERIDVVFSEAVYWRSVENEVEPFRSIDLAEREAGPLDESGALDDWLPIVGTYGPEHDPDTV